MLSLEDCLELSKLTEDEILIIAKHERIPEIAALELANYLICTPDGEFRIKGMIKNDITQAANCGDRVRELGLKLMLRNYVAQHPGCNERLRDLPHEPDRRTSN